MYGLIFLGIVVVFGGFILSKYNGFVTLRNRYENAWAQINVELKRRYDLIPNLVNAVKGYMTHEKDIFENVAKARSSAMQSNTVAEHAETEAQLTKTLKSLFAVMENYPELKANENVMKLQEELTSTENRISFSRQFYNDIVMRFNQEIQLFPGNIIAGFFNFRKQDYFQVNEAEVQEAPKVNL
jgi:LemA protein